MLFLCLENIEVGVYTPQSLGTPKPRLKHWYWSQSDDTAVVGSQSKCRTTLEEVCHNSGLKGFLQKMSHRDELSAKNDKTQEETFHSEWESVDTQIGDLEPPCPELEMIA